MAIGTYSAYNPYDPDKTKLQNQTGGTVPNVVGNVAGTARMTGTTATNTQPKMDNYINAQANGPKEGVTSVDAPTNPIVGTYVNAQGTPKEGGVTSTDANGNPITNTTGTGGTTGGNGTFTTDVGKTAADKLAEYLKSGDPLAKAAQANEDTAASRRAYVARLQTDQQLGQTHFAPGTAQYNRALNESRAGVDIANQQGRANVNQYTRERTQDLLGQAKDLESTQYGRVKDTTNSLLAQIPNPKAKSAFMRNIAAGMDPNAAYLKAITEEGESVVKPQDPAADLKLAAGASVTASTGLKPGDPGYDEAVAAKIKAEEDAKNETIRLAKEKADTDEALKVMNSGGKLTPAQQALLERSGDIPVINSWSEITPGSAEAQQLKYIRWANLTYKVLEHGKSAKGVPFMKVQDPKQPGKVYYVYNGGQWAVPPA